MKKKIYKNSKQTFTRELFLSKGFFGNSGIKGNFFVKNYLLGSRKNTILFDIEKTVTSYIKAVELITRFQNAKLKILFIGSPLYLENIIKGLLQKTQHTFISEINWVPGMLTNKKYFPSLIVNFKKNKNFSKKESFKKNIPLISFVDEKSSLKNIDFPILINLKSRAAAKMYFNIIKQLKNVKS